MELAFFEQRFIAKVFNKMLIHTKLQQNTIKAEQRFTAESLPWCMSQRPILLHLLHNKSPIELLMFSVAPIEMEIGEERVYCNG
jgi:hypothetical protein